MVSNSFKTSAEIRKSPIGLPDSLYIGNYIETWNTGNFGRLFINSLTVLLLSMAIIYIINLLTAYPFARMNFKGKKYFFLLFLSGMMFPMQMAIIPLFKIITSLRLVNNPLSLALVYAAFSMPMGIYILSTYLKSLPREIEEAAEIDGCSSLKKLLIIIVPLSKPALATILIINGINVWNDLLLPIIVMTKNSAKTLPAGLMYFSGQYQTQWEYITAGIVIISTPMVVFYLFMQKDIINGLASGAVKS
ncbi:MAG: carbohydrate ABC transporter permease [Spirochaetales bacterium]|nr:carbohydrate ABC transporter permease [Spirochaetales bacterium]